MGIRRSKNMPKIHCKYDKLVAPRSLKPHPQNRNSHDKPQITRLAKLYAAHGVRHPIVVSNLSGSIVAGHGRREAAILAGLAEMPVVYQDFESAAAEYTFMQSDNAIALWADLDIDAIAKDLGDMKIDLDVDLLGIDGFSLVDDVAAAPPPKIEQASVIETFLNSDMRYLQLVYPINIYDPLVVRLNSLCEAHAVDNYSDLLLKLVEA